MPNIFKTQEQRDRWNAYNNKYSKENYHTFCLKFHKKTDKDIIDYLSNEKGTVAQTIKYLIREKMAQIGICSEPVVEDEEKEVGDDEGLPFTEEKNKMTNNIRKIRKQHGLTQTKLAEILGVTKQGLSFNETGRVSRKMAEAVANYFNVSVLEVMGLDAFEYTPTSEKEKQYLIALLNQLQF